MKITDFDEKRILWCLRVHAHTHLQYSLQKSIDLHPFKPAALTTELRALIVKEHVIINSILPYNLTHICLASFNTTRAAQNKLEIPKIIFGYAGAALRKHSLSATARINSRSMNPKKSCINMTQTFRKKSLRKNPAHILHFRFNEPYLYEIGR